VGVGGGAPSCRPIEQRKRLLWLRPKGRGLYLTNRWGRGEEKESGKRLKRRNFQKGGCSRPLLVTDPRRVPREEPLLGDDRMVWEKEEPGGEKTRGFAKTPVWGGSLGWGFAVG